MASEQGMSGIDVMAMTSEIGAKAAALGRQGLPVRYPYARNPVQRRGQGKSQLIIEAGRRAHLVKDLPEPPKNPPQFAMLLRKYISGGKVLAIRQHGLERILIFDIGKGKITYRLIIELFDEGNVILADDTYTIVKPLWHHRFRDREVVPNVPYILSSTDPTGSPENIAAALRNDGRDLVRALAIGCMLGGTYAEYICRKTGLDKSATAASADPGVIFAAIQDLFSRVLHDRSPVISPKHCEPIDLGDGNGMQSFPTFSEALEAFFPLTKTEKKSAARPKIAKEDRIRLHQEAAVKKFDAAIKKNGEIVNAIYENYAFIRQVITSLDAASKRLSWQEIEKQPKDTASDDAKKITAFYPAEAAVEVDIGRRVKIHVHESVEQNAGRVPRSHKKIQKEESRGACCHGDRPPEEEGAETGFYPPEKTVVPPLPLVRDQRRRRRPWRAGRLPERGTGQKIPGRGRPVRACRRPWCKRRHRQGEDRPDGRGRAVCCFLFRCMAERLFLRGRLQCASRAGQQDSRSRGVCLPRVVHCAGRTHILPECSAGSWYRVHA